MTVETRIDEGMEPAPAPVRILVTGSRELTDRELVRAALNAAVRDLRAAGHLGPVVVVHGDARGADRIARDLARSARVADEAHPADWDGLGKSAGHTRNQAMADCGASVCLAFLRDGAANRHPGHDAARTRVRHPCEGALAGVAGIAFRRDTSGCATHVVTVLTSSSRENGI
ncbi:DUF2493 domain-containing protein [Gryllotalpicola reticulitermitis]|uniref:DUF2493 domain-containing protein n=1 Tax=Gryllotalpicola reticulitermitis TaxID=1184153 RepID=A0ABV8QCF8_9MICO